MHLIDNQGRYRRFVLQQTALDAIWHRVEHSSEGPREQLLAEAAAVLAGTILMASGTTGSSPETHDSSVTTGTAKGDDVAVGGIAYGREVEDRAGVAQGLHGPEIALQTAITRGSELHGRERQEPSARRASAAAMRSRPASIRSMEVA
jgi:hypothetical protein